MPRDKKTQKKNTTFKHFFDLLSLVIVTSQDLSPAINKTVGHRKHMCKQTWSLGILWDVQTMSQWVLSLKQTRVCLVVMCKTWMFLSCEICISLQTKSWKAAKTAWLHDELEYDCLRKKTTEHFQQCHFPPKNSNKASSFLHAPLHAPSLPVSEQSRRSDMCLTHLPTPTPSRHLQICNSLY